MNRVYNFSAGPSMLPISVLEKVQKELLNYNGAGMSVMEMSHRSKTYDDIIVEGEKLLREIMGISDDYYVLFLQGGASTQFAMIPLNLMQNSKKADFINTGVWSKKAISEASRHGEINVVASSEDENFSYIPEIISDDFTSDADYFHITSNNTIMGTRFTELPDTGSVPLIADMSSNILSQEYDVSKFGMIYAGAQKNMGPAGVTVVIVRKDLVGNASESTPTMLNYKTHADKGSMFNTPPTFSIYVCKLVFEWIKSLGGVKAMQQINESKAAILYDYLDESKMFKGTVAKKDRSLMNIPFVTESKELDAMFIEQAATKGLMQLKGHRLVGGMRASIYNAMPTSGVKSLVEFMKEFEVNN